MNVSGATNSPLVFAIALSLASFTAAASEGASNIEFIGKDLHNKELLLSEQRGKVVLLAFWASWCPPCRDELPKLEAIQRGFGSKAVRVVALNYDESNARNSEGYKLAQSQGLGDDSRVGPAKTHQQRHWGY